MSSSTETGAADAPERSTATNQAADLRTGRTLGTAIMTMLAVLTLVFAAANYGVLAWKRKQGLPKYTLDVAATLKEPVEFRAAAEWQRDGVPVGATAPGVLLDGRRVDDDSRIRVAPGSSQPIAITLALPPEIAPGLYEGVLRLDAPDGALSTTSWNLDISMRVNDWWEDWWMLRWWGCFALACYFVLWALCMAVFPAPSGSLEVVSSGGESTSVALGGHLSGWLMPWRRGMVRLDHVLSFAGASLALPGIDGMRFQFVDRWTQLPVFVSETDSSSVAYLDASAFLVEDEPRPVSGLITLDDQRWLVLFDPDEDRRNAVPGQGCSGWRVRIRHWPRG